MAKMASLHAEGYTDKDLQDKLKKKWIKFEKGWHGLSANLIIKDKIELYAGQSDTWSIAAGFNLYDRSLTLQIFNLYIGIAVWHKND